MSNFFLSVIKPDPRFTDPNLCKDMGLLEPNVRRKVAAIISDARANGHELIVLETFRSQARQEQLFHEGRTQLQHVGTHGFGLACDLAFVDHGQINWQADYSVLAHLAGSHELVSGYYWHSKDSGHVQWCKVSDQYKLFAGEWYPPADGSYNPLI